MADIFPNGGEAQYDASLNWDGQQDSIEAADWVAIDGLASSAVRENPLSINLRGWLAFDAGQEILRYSRLTRKAIGFRLRPNGGREHGECYKVRVLARDLDSSAEGGLQPVHYYLEAFTGPVPEVMPAVSNRVGGSQ